MYRILQLPVSVENLIEYMCFESAALYGLKYDSTDKLGEHGQGSFRYLS